MRFLRLARFIIAPAITAISLTAFTGCSSPAKAPASASMSAPQSIATFDAVWQTVRDEHFDPSLNGVDWNAVRDELRPRAASARTPDELRAILSDMLSRLGQSHFVIIPATEKLAEADPTASPRVANAAPDDDSGLDGAVRVMAQDASDHRANDGTSADAAPASAAASGGPGLAGIDIALVDGAPLVLRVMPDSPGSRAGVLVGWELVAVDGVRVDDILAPTRRELAAVGDGHSPQARELRARLAFVGGSLLAGQSGTIKELVFADASGAEQRITLSLAETPFGSTKFGNLPALPVEIESRIMELPVDGGKPIRIGLIGFNIWMTGASDALDRAVDSMRGCDGIVIDLRGNPGGMGAMSMGLAGHFVREPVSLGSMIGRDNTLEFKALPRKVSAEGKRVRPYATKPLAILIDSRSASTSELFAGGLQELGRARVFGETSAGMALPAQAKSLPNGDALLHAVADFVTPKGTRLEGRGVVPDEPVAPTREQLSRGEDPSLTAASRWIEQSTRETRAARSADPASAMPVAMPAPVR